MVKESYVFLVIKIRHEPGFQPENKSAASSISRHRHARHHTPAADGRRSFSFSCGKEEEIFCTLPNQRSDEQGRGATRGYHYVAVIAGIVEADEGSKEPGEGKEERCTCARLRHSLSSLFLWRRKKKKGRRGRNLLFQSSSSVVVFAVAEALLSL